MIGIGEHLSILCGSTIDLLINARLCLKWFPLGPKLLSLINTLAYRETPLGPAPALFGNIRVGLKLPTETNPAGISITPKKVL